MIMLTARKHTQPMPAHQGYTLLELALVIVIASIALLGAMGVMRSASLNNKQMEDKTQLNAIKSSIIQYAINNGRLPCPDFDGNGRMGVKNNPNQQTSCGLKDVGQLTEADDLDQQQRVVVGYVPYLDLGLADANNRDGHPFQYVATLHYADVDLFRDPTPYPEQYVAAINRNTSRNKARARCDNATPRSGQNRPTFTLCSKGGVALAEVSSQGTLTTLYDDIPFAVVSLGKNGTNSPTQYEQKNIKSRKNTRNKAVTFNNTNKNDAQNKQNRVLVIRDASDAAFDDQVVWETSGILALRLLEAGVLP